eukprot:6191399-Pleurochrysis_carterae.AAC.1
MYSYEATYARRAPSPCAMALVCAACVAVGAVQLACVEPIISLMASALSSAFSGIFEGALSNTLSNGLPSSLPSSLFGSLSAIMDSTFSGMMADPVGGESMQAQMPCAREGERGARSTGSRAAFARER